MNLIVNGAVVGGALGGLAAALSGGEDPVVIDGVEHQPAAPSRGRSVLRGIASGAAAGAGVAVMVDRQARAAAGAVALTLAVEAQERGRDLAERSRPALTAAYETVSDQLHDVGETVGTTLVPSVVTAAGRAADVIGEAVDAGRPHLAEAITQGRLAIGEAVETARPVVGSAVDTARERVAARVA